jgi:hypothetical protein
LNYTLSDVEKECFKSALTAAVSVPFIDSIEDYVVESIWAHVKGIVNPDPFFNIRSKKLYDVVDKPNHIGWSVKSVQWPFTHGCDFELVIQRAAIIRKADGLGFEGLSLESNPQLLGAALLKHWGLKVDGDSTEQAVNDRRIMVLLKTKDKTRYAVFEENIKQYTIDDIHWRWSSTEKKGLQGIRKVDGKCIYRWHPSQTQFFESFQLPVDAYCFILEPRRIGVAQVVDTLNAYLQEHR